MGMVTAILMGVCLLTIAGGCPGKNKSRRPAAVEAVTELPLPAVPDTISDPTRRSIILITPLGVDVSIPELINRATLA